VFLNTQVLVECGNNFNERTHDKGEETNTGKHDKDTKDHFKVADRVKITITNSRKSGDWIIAWGDQFVRIILFLQVESCDESRSSIVCKLFLLVRDQVECATGEESNDNSHEDEAEHLVNIFHDQLEDNFLATSLSTKYGFNRLVKLRKIKQVHDTRDTDHSEQFEPNEISSIKHIEWESSNHIKEEPTRFQILFGDLRMLSNPSCAIRLNVLSHEIKDNIKSKEYENGMFQVQKCQVILREIEGSKVEWRETRVSDNDQNDTIEGWEELAFQWIEQKVVLESLLWLLAFLIIVFLFALVSLIFICMSDIN